MLQSHKTQIYPDDDSFILKDLEYDDDIECHQSVGGLDQRVNKLYQWLSQGQGDVRYQGQVAYKPKDDSLSLISIQYTVIPKEWMDGVVMVFDYHPNKTG